MVKRIIKRREFSIFMIVLFISAGLSIISNAFLSADNLQDVLKSNVVIGVMALGMLPVLITGGIDVSVSSTIALCAVVAGKMLTIWNADLFLILVVSILCGAAVGAVNGIIIDKIKISPIVATLGTMAIVLGGVMYFTNGEWITNLPQEFKDFGTLKIMGVSVQIIIFIIMALITAGILKYTLLGRGMYALGGNESSANRVGYHVSMIKILTYVYNGAMAGLAAVLHTSIVQQVDPNTFNGLEMDVIACVVIGGASTIGGFGSVTGTVLGVILMAIMKNGLVLAHIPTYWQKIVIGFIILLAVSVDVINRRREVNRLVRVDVKE